MLVKWDNQDIYKKQVEVARLCGVSGGTITNWINRAKEDKNLLQLVEINHRFFIIRNDHNYAELMKLKKEAENYQNVEYTNVYAKDELYEIMTESQLISLINYIKINSFIPIKYTYLGDGANRYDEFYNAVNETKDDQIKSYGIDSDKHILNHTFNFFKEYFEEFDTINLVDLGPGNGYSSISVIQSLYNLEKLGKYVAVDINDKMNQIAKRNFIKYFPEEYFASHVLDIEINSLQDILFSHKESQHDDKKVLNFVFLAGSTICNFESQIKALQNMKEGMFPEDLLVIDNIFDDPNERSMFRTVGKPIRDKIALYIVNLLGLDKENFYEKETVYNIEKCCKEYNLIMKKPIKINLRNNRFITLEEGQKLNIWKAQADTFESVARKMKSADLNLQYIAKHPKENKLICVTKV